MANRFPLVLDTTDNNKIKEIQSGDNLNLADNSIVGVQNITAIGTIDAADIRVAGNRLVAQNFADLTDTPSSFIGSQNYFVKVKADGTGLEYRPLSDLGNIEIDTITVGSSIVPGTHLEGNIGTPAARFDQVVATSLYGNLRGFNDEIVFNASTAKISYAALQGAPTFLSEFTNDVGYLRTVDLDTQLAALFDEGQQFVTDIQGSVFGDDSTLLVDAVASVITGDVLNSEVITTELIATTAQITTTTVTTINGPTAGDLAIDAGVTGIINIGTGASTTTVNIENAVFETFDQGTGLGAAQITADTDLVITAGNRVKINGGVPFGFASVSASEQLAIGAQEGDVIYNTTTSRLQMYQGAEWKDLTGNVEATSGTSNFNDVVVAGNLTVQGTTTSIDTANTTIKDNVIVLNDGEIGAGVTGGTSGIEIDRGDLANVTFVWNETVDKWTIGAETLVAATFEGNLLGNVTGNVAGNTSGTHTGAVVGDVTGNVTGNVVGDLVGSVFGDDSTILVDAVNNTIPGLLTGSWSNPGNTFNVFGLGLTVSAPASSLSFTDFGLNTAFNDGTNSSSYSLSSTSFSAALGDGTNNAAYSLSDTGISAAISDDSNSLAFTVNAGGVSLSTTGQVVAAITGDVGIVSNGDFTVTADNIIISTSGITANITGNIDNAALTIGATTATTIAIGNSGSTTTINGTVNLSALVAGSITADDSISITTATGDGNAISIGPDGTNTFVNLTADNIRFFGPITTTITATGGVIGDLTGSVVADDSTVMIDGQSGTIVGPIASTNISGTLVKATTIENHTTDDLAINVDGFININAGTDDAGLSKIQIDQAGINYIELTTEPTNPSNPADVANIAINATSAAGDVVIGTTSSSRSQAVTIHNATVNGALVGSAQGNHTGTLTGDVVGSVFADDSAPMVDAVNYALFSDTLSLTPLNAEPANPVNGMIAVADGVGWDPASNARNTLVAYLGSAWVTVAAAA